MSLVNVLGLDEDRVSVDRGTVRGARDLQSSNESMTKRSTLRSVGLVTGVPLSSIRRSSNPVVGVVSRGETSGQNLLNVQPTLENRNSWRELYSSYSSMRTRYTPDTRHTATGTSCPESPQTRSTRTLEIQKSVFIARCARLPIRQFERNHQYIGTVV